MARVGLIFGGRSVEHQVSIRSARTVAQGLAQAGHEVIALGVAQDGGWIEPARGAEVLASETAREIPPLGGPVAPTLSRLLESGAEVLFPLVHGTWGEDGTLQGLCEMLDLPYVGAGVTASAVAMDKVLAKRALAAAGVPVVEYETATRGEFEADRQGFLDRCGTLPYPLFVKPRVGGSSVGVARVDRAADLAGAVRFALEFDEAVLVERGVSGRELECAVIGLPGRGSLEASALGEVVPGNAFYDYADKYLQDTAQLVAPAAVPKAVSERARRLAVDGFAAVAGSGMARVDFFLEGERLYVNEINTLPGFTSISMYPRLWGLSGLPLPALVDRLVREAVERHAERHRLDRGIKEWLAQLAAGA
jgi:D-alanine-D-alanine ligase